MKNILKNRLSGALAGLGLLCLAPLAAHADTRVFLNVGGYGPAPEIVAAPAPYYAYGPGEVRADWERDRWYRHHEWREHRWHEEHEWREYHDRDWR